MGASPISEIDEEVVERIDTEDAHAAYKRVHGSAGLRSLIALPSC